MSLISVRNLILPFSNKVHLTTIILSGVVFAVLRLSTGAIEIRSHARPIEASRANSANTVEAAAAPENTAARDGRLERRNSQDLLGEMVGKSKAAPPAQVEQPENQGALDDIERSLGLR